MKKIFSSLFIMAAITAMVSTSSCTKVCDEGYEGSDCKTEVRAKFLGQYQGNETCTVGTDAYTLTVAASSTDVLKISLSNVYNQGFTAVATVNGNAITVESQTVASGVTVSGTGTLTGTTIAFTYAIASPAGNNSCTFTGTKI